MAVFPQKHIEKNMHTRCALVGMPGSGKSTVGRHLARQLQLPFIDMDQRLEAQLGISIRAFFEQHGEDAFREREAALLAELAVQTTPVVLSTGGGIVLRADNRKALRQGFAPVLYLRATPEDIFLRVRHDRSRPLLQVDDPMARLRSLYQARDVLYREAAHCIVETGQSQVASLVGKLVRQMEVHQAMPYNVA